LHGAIIAVVFTSSHVMAVVLHKRHYSAPPLLLSLPPPWFVVAFRIMTDSPQGSLRITGKRYSLPCAVPFYVQVEIISVFLPECRLVESFELRSKAFRSFLVIISMAGLLPAQNWTWCVWRDRLLDTRIVTHRFPNIPMPEQATVGQNPPTEISQSFSVPDRFNLGGLYIMKDLSTSSRRHSTR
jgi:hypothetical protein